MNSVHEIGYLGGDPELRYTSEGTAVANFSLGVNEKFTGNEKVHFFPIVCWRKLAEAVAEYQKKGSKVAVEGRLEQQRWEDKDGNKRSAIKIVASRIEFLSPRKNGDEEKTVEEDDPPVTEDEPPVIEDEDTPF